MASELTQDAVLQFLRGGGGSVKNSELLLHFRRFIRDHEDRDRNRDIFKKFVNSVASVQQLDGVAYVVLKRKFKGRVPGGGDRGRREPSPGNARASPGVSAEKPRQKPLPMEMTTTAPPGGTAPGTILPAAGIMQNNNNNVEMNFNIKQQDEISRPGHYGGPAPGQTARLLQPLPPDQRSKIGSSKVGFDPIAPGITPVVSAVRPHGETRQQIPIQEPLRGREAERQATSFPELPAQDWSTKVGQHNVGFTPPDPGFTPVVSVVRPHGETRQQIPIQERHRGREAERQILSFSEPPVQDWSRKAGQHEAGFTPLAPGITPSVPAVRSHSETRQQIPNQEPLRGREAELKTPSFLESPALDQSPQMGQNRFSFDPVASGIAPTIHAVKSHEETRQQHPSQELHRGREAELKTPSFLESPALDRSPKMGQNRFSLDPVASEITPAVHVVRSHEETRQQIPIQEPISGREAELKTPSFPEPPALDQSPKMGQNRFSFDPEASGITPAVHAVRSRQEIRPEIPTQEPISRREADVKTTSFPEHPGQDRTSKPRHSRFGFSSLFSGITSVVSKVRTHGESKQQEHLRGREAELKTPTFPESPALDRSPKMRRFSFDPLASGITPVISEVRRHEEIRQIPIKEPLRGQEHDLKEIPRQGVELHPPSFSDPPARDHSPKVGHKVGFAPEATEIIPMDTEVRAYGETVPPPETQVSVNAPRRRHRHRKSYKSAVSYDEDEEEEGEEVVLVRRGSSGGEWPLSVPLGDMGKALSASSPCIIDVPSISTSPTEKLPKIYVQGVKEEELLPREGRHSFPLEAERYIPSTKMAPHHVDVHADRRFSQPADFQQRGSLSSSTSNIYSPSSDSGLSMRDWPMSGSPRGLGWNSSSEDLHTRAENSGSDLQIQEAIQRAQRNKMESTAGLHGGSKLQAPWHHSTGHLLEDQEPNAHLLPFYHSTDRLHENQLSVGRVKPKHLSTGDLYDDHQEPGLSEESTSSSPLRQHSAIPRRLSSHLRSRMCRSMGADLDQLLQEEEERGDNEAARLNRLHLISSTLSLPYNVSTSSLSSCSTPPFSHSLANLTEGGEGRGGKKSVPNTSSSAPPEGSGRQSQVPLESREHDWLVKGAAGAWPDIYSLFREDSTLLNRRDFITGFTVLHWIAKHGDHRVLNTLWYGVQKAGLSFDINARSTCGHTPLHIAAMHGHKNIMRLLVNKFHADVKLRDTAGKKPWHYLSRFSPPDVFQLLGAPARAALGGGGSLGGGGGGGGGGVVRSESMWKHEKRRRRRHHLSSASSGDRPQSISAKVKRSSSIAAFLKHKSLRHLQGHQSDSSI